MDAKDQPRSLLIAVVAALGFAMTEMVIEAVAGRGFWAPLCFVVSASTLGATCDPPGRAAAQPL